MQIKLKGLAKVTSRLADGSLRTYYYAWRGGPQIKARFGTPQFIAEFNELTAERSGSVRRNTLQYIITAYETSGDFRALAERTRADYAKIIVEISAEFGDFPLRGLADKRARNIFMEWRDKRALRSLRQADYGWTVLARILSWAKNRGLIEVNPCTKGGRLYDGTRVDRVWSDADELAYLECAPAHMQLPVLLGLWTGQRQGDLLRLTWSAYDGEKIRLSQRKSLRKGRRKGLVRVEIPVGQPLKERLDAERTPGRKAADFILLNSRGRPWTAFGFRHVFREVCDAAGIRDLTFHDLRGTAVTRLAICGCTEAEIATITGHSLRDVRSILDTHYLNRDPQLARNAIRKLEARQRAGTPE